jgi:hypothetical protein
MTTSLAQVRVRHSANSPGLEIESVPGFEGTARTKRTAGTEINFGTGSQMAGTGPLTKRSGAHCCTPALVVMQGRAGYENRVGITLSTCL